jgi:serine/threonine protein kinase/Tfp pilus assembly protein PilF
MIYSGKQPVLRERVDAGRPALPAWLAAVAARDAAGDSAAGPPRAKSERLGLAYEEYCERREAGEAVDADTFCAQFPSLRSSLSKLLKAHRFLEEHPELLGEVNWPQPGETFVGFELVEELGRGNFARVFLATEPALGQRTVAVKISRGGSAEAKTLGRISHPHIVPVYSVQEDPATGLTAVCMPYLGSATLCDILDHIGANAVPAIGEDGVRTDSAGERPALSPLQCSRYLEGVRRIGAQLAEALLFIHQHDICHRDLKPSNVLMTPDGQPMLLDFNLCADAKSADMGLGGTLPYMSPEQLLATDLELPADPTLVDARSDLFSLGVILYELLTGRHPFGPLSLELSARDLRRLLIARHQGALTPVRALNAEVDPTVARRVEQCLAYNPNDRPQHAGELAKALRHRPSPFRRVQRWIGRHAWLTALLACLVLTVGGAAAAWWSQRESAEARHWRLGQAAYHEHQYQVALDHFNRLLEADADRFDVLWARARTYQQMGENDDRYFSMAVADYQNVERHRPEGRHSACIGYCMLRSKQIDVAQAYLDQAVARGFVTAEVLNDLGFACEKLGKLDLAEKHLDQALVQGSNLRSAFHNRAWVRWQRFLRSGGLTPPLARKNKPVAAEQKQQEFLTMLRQAKADLTKALEIGPATMELHRDAGWVWTTASAYEPSDAETAIQHLKDAVKLGYDPKHLAKDNVLTPLLGNPAFQGLMKAQGTPVRPLPPTLRLVDPLKGQLQ